MQLVEVLNTIIDKNGKRADKTEYPIRAIREIILNAVIHRDYSIHTEKSPIRILMFRDRIEVENPGGLYGRIALSNLGKVGADTRNPYIASNLEIMIDTESRFSGIPIIIHEMEKAGLKLPVFENGRGVFKVTLYNGNESGSDSRVITKYVSYSGNGLGSDNGTGSSDRSGIGNSGHMAERLLEFCETPRTRAELIRFTGFSRYYTMSKIVQPLVDSGKLTLTLPDKPKSAKQMFVKV
jgi:ATP-dependent DNA helicase RecG